MSAPSAPPEPPAASRRTLTLATAASAKAAQPPGQARSARSQSVRPGPGGKRLRKPGAQPTEQTRTQPSARAEQAARPQRAPRPAEPRPARPGRATSGRGQTREAAPARREGDGPRSRPARNGWSQGQERPREGQPEGQREGQRYAQRPLQPGRDARRDQTPRYDADRSSAGRPSRPAPAAREPRNARNARNARTPAYADRPRGQAQAQPARSERGATQKPQPERGGYERGGYERGGPQAAREPRLGPRQDEAPHQRPRREQRQPPLHQRQKQQGQQQRRTPPKPHPAQSSQPQQSQPQQSQPQQSQPQQSHPPSPPLPSAPATAPTAQASAGVRLNKYLADARWCSRREADDWVTQGWVRINGQVAHMGQRVLPGDTVEIADAAHARQARRATIVLHKPVGYVSAQAEPGYTPAIALVTAANQWTPPGQPRRAAPASLEGFAPAGRLDIDSTGLLLLTQDGRLARHIIGQDSTVEKEYLVRVSYQREDGQVVSQNVQDAFPAQSLALLRHGLALDGQPLLPAQVHWQNPEQLRFVLREGKKRQIRRMCELVGLHVTGLKRIRIGQLLLGALPPGQWRYLDAAETV